MLVLTVVGGKYAFLSHIQTSASGSTPHLQQAVTGAKVLGTEKKWVVLVDRPLLETRLKQPSRHGASRGSHGCACGMYGDA